MTIVEAPPGITGGVDTHLDTHVAAALDPLGRLVGTESFDADAAGYKALARLVSYAVAGVPNEIMGEGPIPASKLAFP